MKREIFERNKRLIAERCHEQIERSIRKGDKYIDEEFPGPLNFFARQAIKLLYSVVAKKDIDEGSRKQIEVVLKAAYEAASELEGKNYDEEDLEATITRVVDRYFTDYLRYDATMRYIKKNHRLYGKMRELTRRIFIEQLKPLVKMLGCEHPDVCCYDELTVKTFGHPDNARKCLGKQLEYWQQRIDLIASDKYMLDTPTAHDLVVRILKKGFADTKKELLGDIDVIFSKYSPD